MRPLEAPPSRGQGHGLSQHRPRQFKPSIGGRKVRMERSLVLRRLRRLTGIVMRVAVRKLGIIIIIIIGA